MSSPLSSLAKVRKLPLQGYPQSYRRGELPFAPKVFHEDKALLRSDDPSPDTPAPPPSRTPSPPFSPQKAARAHGSAPRRRLAGPVCPVRGPAPETLHHGLPPNPAPHGRLLGSAALGSSRPGDPPPQTPSRPCSSRKAAWTHGSSESSQPRDPPPLTPSPPCSSQKAARARGSSESPRPGDPPPQIPSPPCPSQKAARAHRRSESSRPKDPPPQTPSLPWSSRKAARARGSSESPRPGDPPPQTPSPPCSSRKAAQARGCSESPRTGDPPSQTLSPPCSSRKPARARGCSESSRPRDPPSQTPSPPCSSRTAARAHGSREGSRPKDPPPRIPSPPCSSRTAAQARSSGEKSQPGDPPLRTPAPPCPSRTAARAHGSGESSWPGDPPPWPPGPLCSWVGRLGSPELGCLLAAGPEDTDLVTSMVKRLRQLEQRARTQTAEIHSKDQKIADLEEKVKSFQRGDPDGGAPASRREEELESLCLQLQSQISAMERFLGDYGLTWVGETLEEWEEEPLALGPLWKPGESTVPRDVDFDLLLSRLRDLNIVAGAGQPRVERTASGARLKLPDPLPLTLYGNGIVLCQGPFRAYSEPSTQKCLQDILDGFFPSELQTRYPDGVPFQVSDRRGVLFLEKHPTVAFSGPGRMVGAQDAPEETSQIPGPKLSLEQFLERLPGRVIRSGQVIDVRDPIRKTLQGGGGPGVDIMVETPAGKERTSGPQVQQPSAPATTNLRVKSETGERTYVLTMLSTETIGDLRRYLARARDGDPAAFDILSAFPARAFDDDTRTLAECGLVPNAKLLLWPPRGQRPPV
ncbi:UBX domain-containing protein 11 [Tachyglossus aculeatus]|uniref:UBX domain-containing protein 11 n=1 Tax=Tachyglossus aculeatus TaxID=9261 RepID=UPI0018F69A96|nr:UBX domain-containing protein 11 [Tachyglossus aculeatus]